MRWSRAPRSDAAGRAPAWMFIAGDPLRGLSALGVLLIHTETMAGARAGGDVLTFPARAALFGPLAWAVEIASGGLFVFFVLSGYLVGRPFVRAFVLGEPFPSVGVYVRNRVLRIVPMLWVTGVLTLLAFGTLDSSARDIAAVFLFAQIWMPFSLFAAHVGHAWTLDIELFFYLLLPLATYGALRLGRSTYAPGRRAALVVAAALVTAAGGLLVRFLTPEPTAPPLAPRAVPAGHESRYTECSWWAAIDIASG